MKLEMLVEGTNIELLEKVRTVLAKALNVELNDIIPETTFGDLPQWDSMGHMEVMMSLESQFGVDITADTIANLTSIPAICSYIDGGDNG